ncbi:MAG: CvpA family protein, partial [Pseudomonadota bacterium]
ANDKEPTWIAEAKSKPMLVGVGTAIRDALPENLDEIVKRVMGNSDKPADAPADGSGNDG